MGAAIILNIGHESSRIRSTLPFLFGCFGVYLKRTFSDFQASIPTYTLRRRGNCFLEDIKSLQKYRTVIESMEGDFRTILCSLSSSIFQIFQNHTLEKTPQISPIDHDSAFLVMTPLLMPHTSEKPKDFLEEMMLEDNDDFCLEAKCQSKRRKPKMHEIKDSMQPYMCWMENQLQKIIEDDMEDSRCLESSLSEDSDVEDELFDSDKFFQKSNSIQTHCSMKIIQKECLISKDPQQEAQSTIDLSMAEFTENIERFSKHPKTEIIKQIRDIEKNTEETEEARKEMIKKYISRCLLEHEMYCYEESWNELGDNLKKTVKTIVQGLEETFSKRIGNLSFEVRRTKLLKYLQKKKRRIWKKKVSYGSRKRVADGRLRIKGKFVTREQACEQLGLGNLKYLNADEIKEMLEHRMDEGVSSQLC